MIGAYLAAMAALLLTWVLLGRRGPLHHLIPVVAVFGLTLPAGIPYALLSGVSVVLWLLAIARLGRRRRRETLAEGCQEPLQAMFEQATLLGNADHCAVSALGACPKELRPVWERAVADWARGASADEAFAHAGAMHSLGPLERLARALALTRHTGTPLSRHLAVLLEDVAEDLRLRREAQSAVWPFAIATGLLAGGVLVEVIWVGAQGGGPVPVLAAVSGLTAGGAPLLAAWVAK